MCRNNTEGHAVTAGLLKILNLARSLEKGGTFPLEVFLLI